MACALLAGCGTGAGPSPGDEPITPAAIAAVVQEHVDLQPRRIAAVDLASRTTPAPATTPGDEPPGAWLQYADVTLEVVVVPTTDSSPRCPGSSDGCVEESVDGHEVTLAWQELEPEEDPGVVNVVDRREGEDVVVHVSGPSVTDDPRNLDLGVPLSDLAALATDPRLSLTTSRAVVDLGDEVQMSGR